jgi:hypothetical protein
MSINAASKNKEPTLRHPLIGLGKRCYEGLQLEANE